MRLRTFVLLFVSLCALALVALAVSGDCGDAGCSEPSTVADIAWVVFLALVGTLCLVALLGMASLAASVVVHTRGGAAGAPPLRLVLIIAAALAGALTVAVGAYLLAPTPLTAKTLMNSVERETGSAGLAGECSRQGDSRWRCDVADAHGSGLATYDVTADGRCWRARRTSPDSFTETPMPARSDGCTRLRDRYPVLSD